MKIINICHSDYANYSYANAAALRSIGLDARALTLTSHHFGYENQAELNTPKSMASEIERADIIQIMHSCPVSLELVKNIDYKNKKVVVYHTGTRFRQEPDKFNKIFNPIIYRGFTDQTEFIKLGIKDVAYIAVAIDTDSIKPEKQLGDKLVLAHYPSNKINKGTEAITKFLEPFKHLYDIKISTELIPHAQSLKRMQGCDIYLELFAPEQNGKEYGCFGVTAFEAAAMGKIVLTQNLNRSVYEDAYGDERQLFSNIMYEHLLIRQLEWMPNNTHFIPSMQKLTRETLVQRHGYKASGERIKALLNI